ncbi:Transposase [Labrenzia sp. THAF35]|nr:Transposase [Labrenzia sp. THAF35]
MREWAEAINATKFSDAQKAFVLKRASTAFRLRRSPGRRGISQATYFNWKKKYTDLLPDDMSRLKQLEEENNRLNKIVADLTLDREMLQDVIRRKL